jgi:hypothetical protein
MWTNMTITCAGNVRRKDQLTPALWLFGDMSGMMISRRTTNRSCKQNAVIEKRQMQTRIM